MQQQSDRDALLARGQAVVARHRRSRGASLGAGVLRTPVVNRPSPALSDEGTADRLLARSLASQPPHSVEAADRHAVITMAQCLSALLTQASPADAEAVLREAAPLTKALTAQVHSLVAAVAEARQQQCEAERAARDAEGESKRLAKKIELYRKQLQTAGEEAARQGTRHVEVAQALAERDELKASLSAALDTLASEKVNAERRASLAEAALLSNRHNDALPLAAANSSAGQAQSALTVERWSSFFGEEAADELVAQAAQASHQTLGSVPRATRSSISALEPASRLSSVSPAGPAGLRSACADRARPTPSSPRSPATNGSISRSPDSRADEAPPPSDGWTEEAWPTPQVHCSMHALCDLHASDDAHMSHLLVSNALRRLVRRRRC